MIWGHLIDSQGLPHGSVGEESACSAGDTDSALGCGGSPGGGNGSPLQHSFLENPTDRGAWWATVHGVTKRQRLATNNYLYKVPHDYFVQSFTGFYLSLEI